MRAFCFVDFAFGHVGHPFRIFVQRHDAAPDFLGSRVHILNGQATAATGTGLLHLFLDGFSVGKFGEIVGHSGWGVWGYLIRGEHPECG